MRRNGVEAVDAGGERKPPAFQVIVLVCALIHRFPPSLRCPEMDTRPCLIAHVSSPATRCQHGTANAIVFGIVSAGKSRLGLSICMQALFFALVYYLGYMY